jgi:large subunit ribosomal protein L22
MQQFAKAISKYIRISPKKTRPVAALIRGKNVQEAASQLQFSRKKAGKLLKKTLDSAVANAETQLDAKKSDLRVHEVRIDEGPTLKRSKPRSRGSRVPVKKRMCHFTIVVATE